MIWKRLKKSTPEEEEEFRERMSEENVSAKDKLAMLLAAVGTILIPSILILVGLCVLVMWIFRIL
ncbi:MAG: hypothetical protein ACI3VZ_02560 [Faecousia sp.]